MSTTIVTSYYLKARDAYPFDLAEVEENLDYALAYDPGHLSSLCLKSHYYLYELNWIEEARDLADRAMAINPRNACAATALLNCMIEAGKYKEALLFLTYVDRKVRMKDFQKYAYIAHIMHLKMNYKIALNYYKYLILRSESPEQKVYVEGLINLIKSKIKHQRKLQGKR